MKLFEAVALIALLANVALALPGANPCSRGPGHWCSSLEAASRCHATAHCVQLWRNSAHVVADVADSSPACSVCQLLASDLEHLAGAGRSQTEMSSAAVDACGLAGSHSAVCRELMASSNGSRLIELIASRLQPGKACVLTRQCRAAGQEVSLDARKRATPALTTGNLRDYLLIHGVPISTLESKVPKNTNPCDACIDVLTAIKTSFGGNVTQAQFAMALKSNVCPQLGPLINLCGEMADQYLEIVFSQLSQGMQPQQICVQFEFCKTTSKGMYRRHPVLQLMQLQARKVKSPMTTIQCEVCEAFVTDARKMLRDGRTQAEIEKFAEVTICALAPAEKDQCIKNVQEYAPILFQLIVSELDPATVCQAIGACGSMRVASSTLPKTRAGPQCLLCELIIREVEQQVGQNATEAEIEAALDNACAALPQTVRQECVNFVQQYTPIIVQLLVNDLSPEKVCTILGLCTSQVKRPFVTRPIARTSPAVCDTCQTVVIYAKALLNENATEQEIVQVVEKVCNFLPIQEQAACRSFLELYGAYAIHLLQQEINPKQICQMLGFCSSAKQKPVTPRLKAVRAGPQCLLCELIIREVEQQVGQNATEAEIEAALDNACAALPQTVRQECVNFVQQYTPIIVQLLVNDLSPEKVCSILRLCTSQVPQHRRMSVKKPVVVKSSKVSSTACDVCQTVIQYAKTLLNENATEQEIVQLLEKVCQFLPNAEQGACHSFIDQYGPYVIQLLLQDVDPQQICQMLGFCSSAKQKPVTPRLKAVRAGPQCLLCELIIREVEQQVGQNATEAEIEAALDNACAALPQTVRQECVNFVQQYTPIIVQLLVNDLSPEKVCSILGLCTSQVRQHRRMSVKKPVVVKSSKVSSTACDVCQTVIQYAKTLLNENATEQEVVQLLEKVCQFLPNAEQGACHSFIDQYGPYVIQLLLQDVDPQQICQMLGPCTSTGRAQKLPQNRQPHLKAQPKSASPVRRGSGTLRFLSHRVQRQQQRVPFGLVQMMRNNDEV